VAVLVHDATLPGDRVVHHVQGRNSAADIDERFGRFDPAARGLKHQLHQLAHRDAVMMSVSSLRPSRAMKIRPGWLTEIKGSSAAESPPASAIACQMALWTQARESQVFWKESGMILEGDRTLIVDQGPGLRLRW
jgi:hypothetical protein